MSDAIFPAGSELHRNWAWTSGNGRAVLRLQEDGNVVLYKDGRAVWQAPNAWSRGDSVIVQEDGNVVVHDRDRNPVWASNTAGHPGATLAVQDDGNAVVYQDGHPLWATNTGD